MNSNLFVGDCAFRVFVHEARGPVCLFSNKVVAPVPSASSVLSEGDCAYRVFVHEPRGPVCLFNNKVVVPVPIASSVLSVGDCAYRVFVHKARGLVGDCAYRVFVHKARGPVCPFGNKVVAPVPSASSDDSSGDSLSVGDHPDGAHRSLNRFAGSSLGRGVGFEGANNGFDRIEDAQDLGNSNTDLREVD